MKIRTLHKPTFRRSIRILVLVQIVALMFNTSISVPVGAAVMSEAWAQVPCIRTGFPPGCIPSGGGGPVPEIPTAFMPVFLGIVLFSIYRVRRRYALRLAV